CRSRSATVAVDAHRARVAALARGRVALVAEVRARAADVDRAARRRHRLADRELVGRLASVGPRVGIARDVARVVDADAPARAVGVPVAGERGLRVRHAPALDADLAAGARAAVAARIGAVVLRADGAVGADVRVGAGARRGVAGAIAVAVAGVAGGACLARAARRRADAGDALIAARALRAVEALVRRRDAHAVEALGARRRLAVDVGLAAA